MAAATKEPYLVPVDVLLLYTRPGPDGTELLIGLRQGGFASGHWDTVSGKLEPGEALQQGMAREAFEETRLRVPADELRLVAVAHWHPPDGTPRVGMFFHLEADPARHGEPVIAEPGKCRELRWAPMTALPTPLLRYTEIGIDLYRSGRPYASVDWPGGTQTFAGR